MNWNLLKKLSDEIGLPGDEGRIRNILRHEIAPFTESIKVDAMGNLIAHIGGKGPKLMLDAHMDEVGFMVNHIEDGGFLRVIPLGGVDPRVFYAQQVIVWAQKPLVGVVGAIPIHLTRDNPSAQDKPIPIEDCFIDLGISAQKVKKTVKLGDLVTFDRKCIETEESFIGKAFDDRIGVFIMIEAVKSASRIGCDLYIVGAVQEEGGMRGAGPAAFEVKPQLGLSLEGTVANDVPGAPPSKRLAIQGNGPEIRLSDSRFVADREWSFFISELAKRRKIKHQIIVKKVGGTNASAVQTTGVGAKTTALSVPLRYIHSPQGIVRKDDIEGAIELATSVIEEAKNFKF